MVLTSVEEKGHNQLNEKTTKKQFTVPRLFRKTLAEIWNVFLLSIYSTFNNTKQPTISKNELWMVPW